MEDDYRIRLAARNEGIEYRDAQGIYRFNVVLKRKEWTLFLPGSRGESYEPYELSKDEEDRILPRIIKYLQSIKWLGIIRRSYSVTLKRTAGGPGNKLPGLEQQENQ